MLVKPCLRGPSLSGQGLQEFRHCLVYLQRVFWYYRIEVVQDHLLSQQFWSRLTQSWNPWSSQFHWSLECRLGFPTYLRFHCLIHLHHQYQSCAKYEFRSLALNWFWRRLETLSKSYQWLIGKRIAFFLWVLLSSLQDNSPRSIWRSYGVVGLYWLLASHLSLTYDKFEHTFIINTNSLTHLTFAWMSYPSWKELDPSLLCLFGWLSFQAPQTHHIFPWRRTQERYIIYQNV